MKFKSFFFIFVLSLTSATAFAQTTTKADSVVDAGILRPLDIVHEDIRWNVASTDLFTAWLDNGLYGYYGPQPKILLDGISLDANFFGWQNLNMLPLFVGEINKVTSRFAPQVYKNTLAGAGLIDFKTASIDDGLTFKSSFYVGNETGDPGPYTYDSTKVSPNVDRWGPDGALSMAYRHKGWYSKGLFLFRTHQQTHLNSNRRLHITNSILGTNTSFVNHYIYTETRTGLLETGYQQQDWQFKVRGVLGESKDYPFLQAFGREVPAETAYRQAALQGSYHPGAWQINGRYVLHHKGIKKRFTLHTYIFDWEQTRHVFALSAQRSLGHFRLKPGVILEQRSTNAPGIHQRNRRLTVSLDQSFLWSPDNRVQLQLNGDFSRYRFGKTVRIKAPVELTPFWHIKPQAYYTELLPIRQKSFTYWVNRGYTFADTLGIGFAQPSPINKNRLSSFEFDNTFSLTHNFSLSLEPQLIHHYALNVPWQLVTYYEFTDTRPGSFEVTRESGERFSFMTRLNYAFSNILQQKISLRLQRTLSGSERYKDYFKELPGTKLNYQLDVFPVPDLSLSVNATYYSSAEWKEFRDIEGEQYRLPSGIPIRDFTGTFHVHTPAYTNINISALKWLWNERLSVKVTIENLLDNEVRMHPLGAELSTKFNIKIGLKL